MAASVANEVKVIGFKLSGFVIRARIALNIKGVQYEFLQEIPGQKSELLLKSNPVYKKIPVLIHNEKTVCESMIIVQYVDDVWKQSGPSILPDDAYQAALHRFWAYFVDDKLFPPLVAIPKATTDESRAEAIEQAKANLYPLEDAFKYCSGGKPFFGGDNIGYLDIALGSMLSWIKALEKMNDIELFDAKTMPLLTEWTEIFCSHDAVKELMPETDVVVEFAQKLRAKMQQSTPAATN